MRVVIEVMPHTSGEAEGGGQQQARTERVRICDGKEVGVAPVWCARTGIGEVLVTIKTCAIVILIGEFPTQQIILAEAVVNLDVELSRVGLTRSGTNPVLINASGREVGLRKQG